MKINNIVLTGKIAIEYIDKIKNKYNYKENKKLCSYNFKFKMFSLHVFKTGMFIVKCKNIKTTLNKLNKIFISVNYTEGYILTVNSIACSYDLNKTIDLYKLYYNNYKIISYEPESFPGCHFRYDNVKVTIFSNGQIVINGIKEISEVDEIIHKIETFI